MSAIAQDLAFNINLDGSSVADREDFIGFDDSNSIEITIPKNSLSREYSLETSNDSVFEALENAVITFNDDFELVSDTGNSEDSFASFPTLGPLTIVDAEDFDISSISVVSGPIEDNGSAVTFEVVLENTITANAIAQNVGINYQIDSSGDSLLATTSDFAPDTLGVLQYEDIPNTTEAGSSFQFTTNIIQIDNIYELTEYFRFTISFVTGDGISFNIDDTTEDFAIV